MVLVPKKSWVFKFSGSNIFSNKSSPYFFMKHFILVRDINFRLLSDGMANGAPHQRLTFPS